MPNGYSALVTFCWRFKLKDLMKIRVQTYTDRANSYEKCNIPLKLTRLVIFCQFSCWVFSWQVSTVQLIHNYEEFRVPGQSQVWLSLLATTNPLQKVVFSDKRPLVVSGWSLAYLKYFGLTFKGMKPLNEIKHCGSLHKELWNQSS